MVGRTWLTGRRHRQQAGQACSHPILLLKRPSPPVNIRLIQLELMLSLVLLLVALLLSLPLHRNQQRHRHRLTQKAEKVLGMSHRALLRYCGNQTEGTARNTYISKWREIHIQKWQLGGRRKWQLGGRHSMAARGDMSGCKFMKLGQGLPDTWSNPILEHFWRFEPKFWR